MAIARIRHGVVVTADARENRPKMKFDNNRVFEYAISFPDGLSVRLRASWQLGKPCSSSPKALSALVGIRRVAWTADGTAAAVAAGASERIGWCRPPDCYPLPLGELLPVGGTADACSVAGRANAPERIDDIVGDRLIIDVQQPDAEL